MRKMYKVILAGVTAFLAACSNDASVDSGISGATTEPSTSPKAAKGCFGKVAIHFGEFNES